MKKNQINLALLLLTLLCCFSACQPERTQQFSVDQLTNNPKNQLGLPVEESTDWLSLAEELETADSKEVKKRLERKGIELAETSYLFYALALSYFKEEKFDEALAALKVAADQYYNPLAMVRLAWIYADTKAEVQKRFPKADLSNFEQDYQKVYDYVHYGLSAAIFMMERFDDRYCVDEVNLISRPLTDRFIAKDSTVIGDFDTQAAAAALEQALPQLQKDFEATYGQKKAS